MKKLSLNIEDLQIDTFATGVPNGTRGTVQGEQISAAGTCLCTRQQCYEPTEAGYATYVNNFCIRC